MKPKRSNKKLELAGIATVIMAVAISSLIFTLVKGVFTSTPKTALELCSSATTWEECKDNMNEFECPNTDQIGSILKDLPDTIEQMTTLSPILVYDVPTENVDKFHKAVLDVIDLYSKSNSKRNPLKFTVTQGETYDKYTSIYIAVEKQPLTHLGNAVELKEVPYYRNCEDCAKGINAWYYDGEEMAYATQVAYLTVNGEYRLNPVQPYSQSELETLLDCEKLEINRAFIGQIFVQVATPDMLLGWTKIEYLYQYEDAQGNMEYGFSLHFLNKKLGNLENEKI